MAFNIGVSRAMGLGDAATAWIRLRVDSSAVKRDMSAALSDVKTQSTGAAKAVGGVGVAAASGMKTATASTKRFNTDLQSVSRSAGQFASRAKYASGIAGLALYGAAKAASDLNETVSFTEVTFKNATSTMMAWGETTLETLGLSKQAALDAANGFGGLFQTTGATTMESAKLSQQMVTLATDMASAKNVRLDEAMLALKSGLIGEAEPMRRFNVLLSENAISQFAVKEGIAGSTDELTEQQKVQARMGIILEQTKDIQGDYARTADSAANAQRRAGEAAKEAGAELGNNLAPILATLAGWAAKLAGAISNLPGPLKTATVAAVGLIAVAGPLAKVIQLIGVASAFAATKGTSLSALFTKWGAVGAVALAAGLALNEMLVDQGISIEEARGQMGDLNKQYMEGALSASAYSAALFDTAFATHEVGDAIPMVVEAMQDFQRITAARATAQSLESRLPHIEELYGGVRSEAARFAEEVDKGRQTVHRFAGMSAEDLETWRTDVTAALDTVMGALERLRGDAHVTAREWDKAFQRQINAMSNYTDNLETVKNRAIPDALLQQIMDMGLEGAGILEFLASASKKEFKSYIGDTKDAGKATKRFQDEVEDASEDVPKKWKAGMDRVHGTTKSTFTDIMSTEAKFLTDFLGGISGVRESVGLSRVEIARVLPKAYMATGGKVPGTGNRDTVPAMLTPGEFVVQKNSVAKYGVKAMERLNKGRTPEEVLWGGDRSEPGLAYFATGGLAGQAIRRAQMFARSEVGDPYVWGGVGPTGWDCSGFMSGITNVLQGRSPNSRLFTTSSFAPGGGVAGFVPGLGQFSVGVGAGHMAGTLAGLNVESTPPAVRAGSGARGATDPMFGMQFHLGSTMFSGGGMGAFGGYVDPRQLVDSRLKGLSIPDIPGGLKGVNPRTFMDARKALIRQVRKATSGMMGGLGGGGANWIRAAMALTHAPEWWFPLLMQTMSAESGGNPRATNSTAVASGEHAQGLMQTIPSTFQSYALPGMTNIFNPIHNAAASIRYRNAAYSGGDFSPYGPISPYDSGGIVQGPGLVRIGNIRERVAFIPQNKRARHVSGLGAGGDDHLAETLSKIERHLSLGRPAEVPMYIQTVIGQGGVRELQHQLNNRKIALAGRGSR